MDAQAPEAEEIQALQRMLIYARQEAERLELWRVWDQLKLTEGLLAEQLSSGMIWDKSRTGAPH